MSVVILAEVMVMNAHLKVESSEKRKKISGKYPKIGDQKQEKVALF